ncbi:retrovirus-related pol polyprotein from transposon TNT 1-94 [Tanacetum coccineum]
MHNNIMAAGSRDRPPMLATGRYAQWKCILEGPYTPSTVIIPAVPATANSPVVPERTTVETVLNMSPKNKAHFESEKEVIHLILTRIGNEIYSTVDACNTAHEMWEAIKRFVTIVKQQHKLDEVSYHKLFDILKQYQKEVNKLHAKRITKNANPLALVATAQPYQDPYYQTSKSHKSYAPTSKASLSTRSHATIRHKGKDIAKLITPPSESASEEDSDPEQARKDKEMQKNLTLIAKYFKKIYKPTNNNLRTSSNTRNKNMDTTPRYKNDNQTRPFRNQRTMTVARGRETVGGQECRKPKRVKDSTYHKEKMLLCKQAEKGVQLQVEQSNWLADTDEEIDEQELEAHYSYMVKIQEVPTADSDTGSEPLEQNDQNAIECDDERVTLANLITNLKLDVDENKKIQNQLKKANASLTQELSECKSILAETSRTLGESNSIQDSLLAQKDIDIKEGLKLKAYKISVVKEKHDELVKESLLTKSHYEGLVKEKIKVTTDLKLKEEKDIDKMISMERQLKFLNEFVYKRSQSIQTIHMLAPKCPAFNGRPTFANPIELVDQAWVKHSNDHFCAPTAYDMEILIKTCLMPLALKTQNDIFIFVHELKQEMHADLKYVESLEKEIDELESDKAEFSNMYDMLLQECVSNDVICSYLHSLSGLDTHAELQCLYLHKVKECECLAQKLLKQTKFKKRNVFLKEREQYFEVQYLKAKLQDKDISICELKKLIEKWKGKSVETKFDKPSVVRKPNAHRILKPSVLGVIHKTNVSRPQLRSTQMKDKVMSNTSQMKFKKTEVEDHPRISSISNQKKSITTSNDSLKSRTLNVNVVCVTCGKYVLNSNHDACVSKYLNDVNAKTKKPKKTSKAWKWGIEQQCPLGYKWVPKTKMKWVPKDRNESVQKRVSFAIDNASRITNIVQLILFIVDSGCTKHITGNLPLLWNFVEKYLGTVHFGNDQFAPILGYGDLVQGNITINRVYYVEDLQGNDLLTDNRGSDLYTISLQETTSSTPICLMAKASSTQAWLWHRRLSHLNFNYINLLSKKDVVIGLPKLKYVMDQLCSSCEVSKAKRNPFKTKTIPSSKRRLNLLHMDLCGPMRVASINGKKYIMVIVDDYSIYTWTLFLRSKDETPEVLKHFLTMIQRNLQALVIYVRTDRGTEFLNKTLNAFFKEEGIEHQTSTPRTPEQNGVVER